MLLALLALLTTADGRSKDEDDFVARVNRPVALTVPGMDRVQVLADRPYASGDRLHRFDAYLSERRSGAAPVVLLLHGGVGADVPLRPKDWGVYRSWGRLLAASGYVAIAFNHRLGFPEPLLAEADQDLGRCWRRSGRNLVRSGRTLAHRAGGLQRGWAAHQKYLAPDAVAAFSPAAQLRTPVARRMPFFLARAGKDTIPDILPGIDAFVAESLVAGTTLTLFNHPEAPHGFDHDPDARTREVLLAFLAFLATHLSPGAAAG